MKLHFHFVLLIIPNFFCLKFQNSNTPLIKAIINYFSFSMRCHSFSCNFSLSSGVLLVVNFFYSIFNHMNKHVLITLLLTVDLLTPVWFGSRMSNFSYSRLIIRVEQWFSDKRFSLIRFGVVFSSDFVSEYSFIYFGFHTQTIVFRKFTNRWNSDFFVLMFRLDFIFVFI